ncbi:MAG: element excision factor XisH family protein [Bacteroidota bacterium]
MFYVIFFTHQLKTIAKDYFHNCVKEALEKENWEISADPLRIYISETAYLEIDLAAENVFAAERGDSKIAVEVKSFLKKSFIYAFHEAIGQYLDYQSALSDVEPTRKIYLAIPEDAFYHELFQGKFIQKRLKEEKVNLIVFDFSENKIVKWINY